MMVSNEMQIVHMGKQARSALNQQRVVIKVES